MCIGYSVPVKQSIGREESRIPVECGGAEFEWNKKEEGAVIMTSIHST